MIEKLDYAMVPTGFVHCFNENCKNASNRPFYPRYALGGEHRESRTYQSYRKVCGFHGGYSRAIRCWHGSPIRPDTLSGGETHQATSVDDIR